MMLHARTVALLRLGLAVAGFAVALVAVALGDRQIGWGAIALLIGSLILRLLQLGRHDSV